MLIQWWHSGVSVSHCICSPTRAWRWLDGFVWLLLPSNYEGKNSFLVKYLWSVILTVTVNCLNKKCNFKTNHLNQCQKLFQLWCEKRNILWLFFFVRVIPKNLCCFNRGVHQLFQVLDIYHEFFSRCLGQMGERIG